MSRPCSHLFLKRSRANVQLSSLGVRTRACLDYRWLVTALKTWLTQSCVRAQHRPVLVILGNECMIQTTSLMPSLSNSSIWCVRPIVACSHLLKKWTASLRSALPSTRRYMTSGSVSESTRESWPSMLSKSRWSISMLPSKLKPRTSLLRSGSAKSSQLRSFAPRNKASASLLSRWRYSSSFNIRSI